MHLPDQHSVFAQQLTVFTLSPDDDDFDSNWEIPDEPSDDMEMSMSSVTVRSFEER